ncbi:MAG: oxygen-insensitive NADPH nitroreductase [Desulfobacteraceae bacterium]|nr:MAG: oxygen-insensitive NADPH nitroreductase [Desulfobacteraceae bacterium]
MSSTVIEVLKSHRSIRKFKQTPVDEQLLRDIICCGQCASTSSNLQATTVIRVRNGDTRKKIGVLAGDQAYVESAAVFLVFCADLNRAGQACKAQGGVFEPGMTEQFIIATVDAALFAQNCAVAAESKGLGICYIGGIRNDPEQVSQLLELPDQVYPVFGFCMGYPDQDPERKPRLPLEVILKEEIYSQSGDKALIESYDEQMSQYYRSRTNGGKESSWTLEMKALVGKESRPHMQAFLKSRGFNYR